MVEGKWDYSYHITVLCYINLLSISCYNNNNNNKIQYVMHVHLCIVSINLKLMQYLYYRIISACDVSQLIRLWNIKMDNFYFIFKLSSIRSIKLIPIR